MTAPRRGTQSDWLSFCLMPQYGYVLKRAVKTELGWINLPELRQCFGEMTDSIRKRWPYRRGLPFKDSSWGRMANVFLKCVSRTRLVYSPGYWRQLIAGWEGAVFFILCIHWQDFFLVRGSACVHNHYCVSEVDVSVFALAQRYWRLINIRQFRSCLDQKLSVSFPLQKVWKNE